MNDYREIRADQVKVGDRVRDRGEVSQLQLLTLGGDPQTWLRYSGDPTAGWNYYPADTILEVEGDPPPAVVTDGDGNAHCENCGQNAVFPTGYGGGSRCPDGEPCDWRPGHTYDQPAA